MKLEEAIALIDSKNLSRDIPTVWADLGCGSGLFTSALASFLFAKSMIYAVDRNMSSFKSSHVPGNILIKQFESDFINTITDFKNLDGILMANAIHFVKDKNGFLKKAKDSFRDKPCFLMVEYNTDTPNPWVPFPASFSTLKSLFEKLGYRSIEKLHEKKSLYNRSKIYSAFISL